MGFWQPLTNLKDYVSQNPPGVTFFFCLFTLAVTFICFGSYSYTHTVPNPDTTKDWNQLLSSLSQFQLCLKANSGSSDLVTQVPTLRVKRENSVKHKDKKSTSITTLRLKVPLAVTANANSGSLQDLSLYTALNASQLHLGGNETVTVTLEVFSGNVTYTCITISAPERLLPVTLLPSKCPVPEKKISPIHVEVSNQLPTESQTCYSLHSKNDPSLTVMLTQEEGKVAVRHLLEVSVCLLGVCVILCLAASMTSSLVRHTYGNGLDLQNEPLIDS